MSLPSLPNWATTSKVLHQIVSLVGPIHKALVPYRNNYLNLSMEVLPGGLVSQTLPGAGKIHVDLKSGRLTYTSETLHRRTFEGPNHTQRSLFEALLETLVDDGLGEPLGAGEAPSLAEGLVRKLEKEEKAGRSLTLEGVTNDDPLEIDLAESGAYADVVFSMFTALSRFKARLEGPATPLIVWPEHFDLSTLWFPASNRGMDDHGPHLSIGFAPFTPGQYQYPYLYVYAYPYPEGFEPPALPRPALWHQEGWTGAVVKYQEIAGREDHEGFVEEIALELFGLLSGRL